MTLDQLEMLEAIVSEGSYHAAARKLHKSQPALSAGIKKLEELYGIKIFSRDGYRPTLTSEGKRFYQRAKATLNSYRQLHRLATELGAGYEPQITLSVDPIVPAHKFAPFLRAINENKHKSQLTITSGVLFDNAHNLVNGEADFAIGYFPQIDNASIESIKICSVELIPVVHKRLTDEQDLDSLLSESVPNIVVKTIKQDDVNSLSTSGYKWYVDSHARKTELILLGMGWGRISRTQLDNEKDLVVIPSEIANPIEIDIHVMRDKTCAHGPIARDIWSAMTNISR